MRVTSTRWEITPLAGAAAGRRAVAAATEDVHLASLIEDRFTVEQVFRAASPQVRGVEPPPPLDVTIPADPNALYVLAVRHEGSDALSFHGPATTPVRRGAAAPATVTFEVHFAPPAGPATRSVVSKAIKGIVLKAAGPVADLAVPLIGSAVEDLIWKRKGLTRGWLRVTRETLGSGQLAPADLSGIKPADRCLLLLHGTFSNTASAFVGLVNTKTADGRDFFTEAAPLYGDRIFAFNHFTVSQTPEENARDLIAGLNLPATFDVITHSRGGLVLRNLAERSAVLGPNAGNFHLGKAVLVASPNEGTPLATADRFDDLISWWANILELFPENPFSTTADYIGESLKFIARHVVDALPGLESMDEHGQQIATLQTPPGPSAGAYSALISNYQPTGNLLARVLDLGIDGIFGVANDLVVPAEGAWKTDQRSTWVAAAQIGCFGLNLSASADKLGVIHTTYFSQPESIAFLMNTLAGVATGLKAVDPDVILPFLVRRGAAPEGAAAPAEELPAPAPVVSVEAAPDFLPGGGEADNILQLFLISSDEYLPNTVRNPEFRTAILLATYRNARVVETIYLRGAAKAEPEPGAPAPEVLHWNDIISVNERIKGYINGKPGAVLPDGGEIHQLGVNLFNAMFPGTVRRIYDVARVDRARIGARLDIVITSMINWVADKPWEFAYDPNRQSFLATEAVNFTRNVLTSVPAQESVSHLDRPLRILVVVAQPIGLGQLSATEEEQVVRRGFQMLEDAGLVTVEYMLRARIDSLHERLRRPDVDILHFIGHGEYREKEKEGFLIFESEEGRMDAVSAESLRQVLCNRGVRLIFLNACETGTVGRSENPIDFNRGVAPKLVAGGIPFLVANQYKVLDVSATEFAKRFYWWLALGSTIGDAAREARVAVNYTIAGENIDWAVPVVYARSPSCSIYTDEEKQHFAAKLRRRAPSATVRPCRDFPGLKIGLWDVNHVVPQLDNVAATLNRRQSDYCFQCVEVTAPIGTWRLTAEPGQPAKGSLDGAEVAAKLRDWVTRLGLDRLVCITSFALKDDKEGGLALWNEDPSQRLSIISSEMILGRKRLDRVVVNRFVANMIACALSGANSHAEPPETCPNHFSAVQQDPEQRFAYLTASLDLCPQCRAKLGDKATALEQILTTW